jgi:hypothetical protein
MLTIDGEQLTLLEPDTDDGTPPVFRVPVLYRCRPCEHRTRRTHVWRRTITSPTRAAWTQPRADDCPTCRRPTPGTPIRGTHNPARPCDARCMYAKGPTCVCACGGANHARGHYRIDDGGR